MTLDSVVTLALVGAAAVYLARRLWRVFRSRGGCACPSVGSCPAASKLECTRAQDPRAQERVEEGS